MELFNEFQISRAFSNYPPFVPTAPIDTKHHLKILTMFLLYVERKQKEK